MPFAAFIFGPKRRFVLPGDDINVAWLLLAFKFIIFARAFQLDFFAVFVGNDRNFEIVFALFIDRLARRKSVTKADLNS